MKAIIVCAKHETRPAPVPSCMICVRLGIEADIVTRTIDALLGAGYYLQTDMREEPRPDKPTRDRTALLRELCEVDDEFLGVFKPSRFNESGALVDVDTRPDSWVRFVYGNDGYDVISDYLTDLEPVIAPIMEYAESLS